jgi:hypothetical protein
MIAETHAERLDLVIGVYDHEDKATQVVEKLVQQDFPADRLSLLHKNGGLGDDMLGIACSSGDQRIKAWGEQGALWGGLWGLLAGATGMFVIPGFGGLLAAGPIVEAIGGAIAGSALGGGTMAGAAALTQLGSALHATGIPEQELQEIHDHIEAGQVVVILHCAAQEKADCVKLLRQQGANPLYEIPIKY